MKSASEYEIIEARRELAARFQDALFSLEAEIPEISLDGRIIQLTLNQVRSLHLVGKYPGIQQKDLARILGITPAAVTNLIRKLTAFGLIKAVVDESDKRARNLELTEKGKFIYMEVRTAQIMMAEEYLQPIPLETQEAIVQALEYALELKREDDGE